MQKRPKISNTLRALAKGKSGGRCWFCGHPEATVIEHLTPWERVQVHELENLVGACRQCNEAKQGQNVRKNKLFGQQAQPNWDLEEFRAVIAKRVGIPVEQKLFFGERLSMSLEKACAKHPELADDIKSGKRPDLLVAEGLRRVRVPGAFNQKQFNKEFHRQRDAELMAKLWPED